MDMETRAAEDAEARVRAAVDELAAALLALARAGRPEHDPAAVELLGVAEFARRAGIGRSTTYIAVADGSLRSLKVRGRRLIPASELARLAAGAGRGPSA